MEFLSFNEFIMWVFAGGGSVVLSSWLLERWAWFQSKQPKVKENIFFVVSSVISVSAYLLITYAPEVIIALQPFFMIEAGVFSYVYLGKRFHAETKEAEKLG